MPEVLDWQRVADPHAVVHYAVQSLRQGRRVAFPTETGYAVTASALAPEAVRQLPVENAVSTGDSRSFPGLSLVVRGAAEARDWAPALNPLGRRLARRLWPGPVTLLVAGNIERGLASRLPEEVRARLCWEGKLSLASPGHEALREVLRHLPAPLVMTAPANGASDVLEVRADVIVEDGPRSPGQPDTVIAVKGNGWEILRPGVVSAEQIRRESTCLVVFICTGNTCRSPLAEVLCKKRLADRLGCAVEELPAQGYQVMSAGLAAAAGGPAAAEAEQVARGYGADLSAHRSQPLTPELAAQADYLVAMTRSHIRSVTDYFSQLGAAPRLLDPAGDIADPLGYDQPVYDECGQQIWQRLEAVVVELLPSEAQQP
jgi:protein-tyrosine phosphatase